MAPKSLILLGLLFAVVFVMSSNVVSARKDPAAVAETKDVEVDGHHHHHCHHPHCSEKTNEEEEEKAEDGHHEHEHHHHCHYPHC